MTTGEELAGLLEKNQVAFVLGAGVTIASTQRRDLSWTELVERGIRHLREQGSDKPNGWFEIVRSELEVGKATEDASLLISAATKLSAAFGGPAATEFKAWLRHEFEGLSCADPTIVELLGSTGAPLLTTNYDTVAERVLGRSSATWTAPGEMELVISGRSNAVGHLHGVWSEPASVVLGSDKYGELVAEETAQHLQRALTSTRSLVFVGCGSTVDDPNVGGIFNWIERNLGESEIFHYWLCTNKQASSRFNLGSRLRAVAFGDDHSALPEFLRALAARKAPIDLAAVAATEDKAAKAADAILDQIRSETIFADHFDDVDTAEFSNLTVPPVVLPVTQQQFVESQELPRDQRLTRCNLQEETATGERVVLASDEKVGLSTALRWLIYRVHEQQPSIVPVFVDFRSLRSGKRPLRKLINRELAAAGYGREDLTSGGPRIALAVDNVLDKPEKIFELLVAEIAEYSFEYVVVGTRMGAEPRVLEGLRGGDAAFRLRYLGRLNRADITSLAALVAPLRAERMAQKAIGIIEQEHLPRTPFTICLLISALIQGKAFLATSSETALLDGYLTLLLGGGDPHEDARFTLDAYERAELLKVLAKEFVLADSGSLTEDEVTRRLVAYFDSVGWSESPFEVIQNLKSRHVLRLHDNKVSFAQASYLHLFAAQTAIGDPPLRDLLFERPLYYAPIIRHYAALNRGDASALRAVAGILQEPEVQSGVSEFFGELDTQADKVLDSESIEQLLHSLSIVRADPADETDLEADPVVDRAREFDPLDQFADDDVAPFPVERLEDAPPVATIMSALTLVSTVLRDSEMVTDLELKRSVLSRTLSVWGKLVVLLEADEDFLLFMDELARRLAEDRSFTDAGTERFVEALKRSAPVLVGLAGMHQTLATRKLIRTLASVFDDKEFANDAPGNVMAAFLSLGINGDQWAEHFLRVQERHPRVKPVDGVMLGLAINAYYLHELTRHEADQLESFIINQHLVRYAVTNERSRKQYAGQIKQKLRRERAVQARERLPAGVTVLENRRQTPDLVEEAPDD